MGAVHAIPVVRVRALGAVAAPAVTISITIRTAGAVRAMADIAGGVPMMIAATNVITIISSPIRAIDEAQPAANVQAQTDAAAAVQGMLRGAPRARRPVFVIPVAAKVWAPSAMGVKPSYR